MTGPLHSHQPFYCEENVWKMFERRPRPNGVVLFISNPARAVCMTEQRAASPGSPLVWDYHVVGLRPKEMERAWTVHDLDTRLFFGIRLESYLARSFPSNLPHPFQPAFRWIPSAVFVERFWSDRSHMLDEHGRYRAPPPLWRAPSGSERGSMPLRELLRFDRRPPGTSPWVDRQALQRFFCGRRAS
ncbi:MAG TPA: hypothetical protein RMG48_15900 [Myxococcales bacterium LLY-WYZ-16_1]|nr:hypothetical protein [Myxococcales bacterium LLY-WYZ-16_1]